MDHLDCVLAGCCWEVEGTRTNPSDSLLSLHQVAKCLTMKLAAYLAKEVAVILRAVLIHETKKLCNDSTVGEEMESPIPSRKEGDPFPSLLTEDCCHWSR